MTDCNEEQTHWKCELLFYWVGQENLRSNASRRPGI